MSRSRRWWLVPAGIPLLATAFAAPASPPAAAAPGNRQAQDLDAMVGAARARNRMLQAQVAQMERQNAAQQAELQQRDARIAALQQQLRAAGAPASATSVTH